MAKKNQLELANKIKEGFSKLMLSARNFTQWVNASKAFMTSQRRVELLTNNIINQSCSGKVNEETSAEDRATLLLTHINIPLLWTDEHKKRPRNHLFLYLTFEWEEGIVDTDTVAELDSNTNVYFSPSVKIPDISVSSFISVSLYYLWAYPPMVQMFQQKKGLSPGDICIDFVHYGTGVIDVGKLVRDNSQICSFHIHSANDQQYSSTCALGISRPESPQVTYLLQEQSSPSATMTGATQKKTPAPFANMKLFGSWLKRWEIGSSFCCFQPRSLESRFAKVVAKIEVNYRGDFRCATFERTNFCVYAKPNTHVCKAEASLVIKESSVTVDCSDTMSEVTVQDSSSVQISIFFDDPDLGSGFKEFFEAYKRALDAWGDNVNVNINSKTTVQVMREIISSPNVGILQLA